MRIGDDHTLRHGRVYAIYQSSRVHDHMARHGESVQSLRNPNRQERP